MDHDVVEKYSLFAKALIHIPDFPWTHDEMMQTTRFLLEQKFSLFQRYSIFDFILRRYAISKITDPRRKEQVWATAKQISSVNNQDLDTHLEPSDISQLLEDLKTMYFVYQDEIFPEINKIKLLEEQLIQIKEHIRLYNSNPNFSQKIAELQETWNSLTKNLPKELEDIIDLNKAQIKSLEIKFLEEVIENQSQSSLFKFPLKRILSKHYPELIC